MSPQVPLRGELFVTVTANELAHVVVASVDVTLEAVGSAEHFPALFVWTHFLHRFLIDNKGLRGNATTTFGLPKLYGYGRLYFFCFKAWANDTGSV